MSAGLPTREDFGDCLDAKSAWKSFGGKTVAEAYAIFDENPLHYQEDFVWMGERAFRFYYPVIDRYLRSGPPTPDNGLECGNILAHDIREHFDGSEDMRGLHEPILSLCNYVLAHLDHYSTKPAEQQEIGANWTKLRQQVTDDAQRIAPQAL
jgi:hypothetical protein